MIKIICLGKIKEKFYRDAIEFHTKRLRDIESEKCNNDDEKKSQEAEIFEIKSIISNFYDLIDYLNSLLK